MRLIQTAEPIRLRELFDNEVSNLKYAILSHRWEEDEITFQEMMEPTEKTQQKKGYQKIAHFCERARADGFEYAWVDTCCINKESSAELSESINSMFRWYLESAKCYAYMSDVNSREELASSVWFTRGWTLQELVAPRDLVFLDKGWLDLGSREDLCQGIEEVTKIERSLLLGKSRLNQFSVAKRMSWAAARETTRAEDRAYCLMGIFNVNMPLLYGEGENAFIRLQEEIMKNSDDESLFAWESDGVSKESPCGLLARSPKDFTNSGDVFPVTVSQDAEPFTSTNRGIQIQSPLLPPREKVTTLVLQCSTGSGLIGIGVMSKPGTAKSEEDFVRRKGSLEREVPFYMLLGSVLDTVYIPKTFARVSTKNKPGVSGNKGTASDMNLGKPGDTLHCRIQPRGHHKKLVICFDDTKAHFTGDVSDSNLAKLHRMFEREENDQVCFYRSWTSDTTFEELVMSGYRFLMEHYSRSDAISLFGYSKGGYAAAYLAHMLDYIGILVNGHEHMIPQVWQIFRDLMASPSETEEDLYAQKARYTSLKAFREAFVRPTGGTLFIGLFDAIDIPSFKNFHTQVMALSPKIVRHAVSVNERQISLQPLLVKRSSSSKSVLRALKNRPGDSESDVQEVWFPGCHKDIGSETTMGINEIWALDHLPLVWMAREARKAGLRFDLEKQEQFQCGITYSEMDRLNDDKTLAPNDTLDADLENDENSRNFYIALLAATVNGVLHDELTFGKGWSPTHVFKKKLKNFLASKRPGAIGCLAQSNYRYIPPGALIHVSVLHRMQADQTYRPPNVHISDSSAVLNKGDPVAECIIQEGDDKKLELE